ALPCLNGGTCFHYIGKYKCECTDAFGGRHCEAGRTRTCAGPASPPCPGPRAPSAGSAAPGACPPPARVRLGPHDNPCVLQPCGNRGACRSDQQGNYVCTCRVGHTGKDCDKDLLPPSGLHVLRVEEGELEIRWDQPHPSPVPVTGFAITYAPLAAGAGGGGRGGRQTDFLDRQQSSHLLQGLTPGELYNISTFSIKRNANSNDISQPAVALIRTRPLAVEQLAVVNVSSTAVWLSWLVQAARHAAATQLRLSLVPADGGEPVWFDRWLTRSLPVRSSLLPGQMYTLEVLTQSGVRAEEFPSTSRPAGPLHIWTRPLPPQNLSLAQVTSSSALITWERPPGAAADGFVVNVTRGLNTRSRFLPSALQGAYTLRELSPGQQYQLTLTAVRTPGTETVHSAPRHLAFSTREWPRPRSPDRPGPDPGLNGFLLHFLSCRYKELIDRRGRITAQFTNLPRKILRHRTTCQRVPHPCTRLFSETKSVPVWEDGVCHYLYKRTYKVQQDVCFREICEPALPDKTRTFEKDRL
uniref:Uncharacterized protein n=1 Tax=Gadus morhua TaxID=8049 RepID=A0A8C4ZZ25_GADMO